MQTIKQFTVSLVNKPGRLATILGTLGRQKVGVLALAVMDSGGHGRLRFVPDDERVAARALDSINVEYVLDNVLLVEVTNHPGAFNKVCEQLAAEHLNIDYAYSSFTTNGKAKAGPRAVIKVNNLAKARKVLSESAPGRPGRSKPGRRPVHAR